MNIYVFEPPPYAKVEYEVAEEQAGFRRGCGTHNHLCSLRLITERARAHRQPLYMCFIDFEKAFDTVSHKKLWATMIQMGFAPHSIAYPRTIWLSEIVCQNVKWDNGLVWSAKGCTPRLHTLSISVQYHVGITNAPSARQFRRRVPYRRKASDQSEICRWYSTHCELMRRVTTTRKPSTWRGGVSWYAVKCKENRNHGNKRWQVTNHSESRSGNSTRGAFVQIPRCKVQRRCNVCRRSKNKAGSRKRQDGQPRYIMGKQNAIEWVESKAHTSVSLADSDIRDRSVTLNKELTGNIEAFWNAVLPKSSPDSLYRARIERGSARPYGAAEEITCKSQGT